VNQLIRYGKVVRPTLGVNVAADQVVKSMAMQINKELNGVLIVDVVDGSPAEAAGLKATVLRSDGTVDLGDLITEIDGDRVVSVEDLLSSIETRAENDVVDVRIWRKCDARLAETVKVKLTSSEKLGGSRQNAWQ
jgi:S1-C subfamily serine protease